MAKSQVLGSMVFEFIGASNENKQLMLEIAQVLNKRHYDADRRASLLREALLVQLTPVTKAVKSIFTEPVSKTFYITFGVSPRDVLKPAEGTDTTDQLYIDADIAKVFTLVGAEAAPTQVTVKERKLSDATLERDIKNALPKSDLSPAQLVYLLATELQKVVNRQQSEFLSKEEWKLFFIDGLVVFVGWNGVDREWRVDVWKQFDGNGWDAGDTVVSLN